MTAEAQKKLEARLEALGREIARREEAYAADLSRARARASELHDCVVRAVEGWNRVVAESVPELQVVVTPPRLDDKHLHAIEFDLERGRHRAVITVKAKREVTLVGPFRTGKNEGPCRTFPFEAEQELDAALGDFLERFLDEAAAP